MSNYLNGNLAYFAVVTNLGDRMKHNEVLWIGRDRIQSSILVDPQSQIKVIELKSVEITITRN